MTTHVGSKIIGTPTLGLRGLVLWLKFDEGSGTTTNDSSLYNRHGSIYGATWTDGKYGKALSFDGEDDYVSIPHISLNTGFTILFWIKTTTTENFKFPIANEGSQTFSSGVKGWRFSVAVFCYMGGCDYCSFFDLSESTSNYKRVDGGKIVDGKWHFIALWWDGSTQRIYVDGVKKDEETFSGDISNDLPITIGCAADNTDFFNGIIDEIRIYNRALSEEEIQMLYHNRIGAVLSKSVS